TRFCVIAKNQIGFGIRYSCLVTFRIARKIHAVGLPLYDFIPSTQDSVKKRGSELADASAVHVFHFTPHNSGGHPIARCSRSRAQELVERKLLSWSKDSAIERTGRVMNVLHTRLATGMMSGKRCHQAG